MATPVPGLHYDRPLTDLSVAYIQSQDRFVADKAFPVVVTEKQSDVYYVWDKDDYMRDEAQQRAPNTEAAESEATPAAEPFLCQEWALREPIPWQRRDNADAVINMEANAVKRISQKLLIRRDALWVGKYFKDAVWGVNITGKSTSPSTNEILQWDQTGSTPLADVGAIKVAVEESTGFTPNVMVLSPDVYEVLKNHPDVLERIKYTERGSVTLELLRVLFEVDKVIVARGVRTTSAKGAAAPARGFITGTGVLLAYAPDAPAVEVPAAGYTFSWRDIPSGGGELGGGFRKFTVESRKADFVEGEFCIDLKVVGADLGAFIKDPIAGL